MLMVSQKVEVARQFWAPTLNFGICVATSQFLLNNARAGISPFLTPDVNLYVHKKACRVL